MLAEFQEVWYERLGHCHMSNRNTKRTASDVLPINSALYGTGLKPCEFERMQIDQVLHMTVIESAKIKLI